MDRFNNVLPEYVPSGFTIVYMVILALQTFIIYNISVKGWEENRDIARFYATLALIAVVLNGVWYGYYKYMGKRTFRGILRDID